ncbi:hypothetical protein AB6F64_08045 [Providencia hangzhouensis]|nr:MULTISPECIES: hypothetical protein [unclassified Providencia]
MDKSRQQFEAFIKKETGFDLHRTKFPMTKREDQQYSCHQTNLAWLSWQASRESLEIEFPQRKGICHNEYDTGYFDGIDKCEDILIRNGVKIKNES